MLFRSTVGQPVCVNPDPKLRAYAEKQSWPIEDFRARAHLRKVASPATIAAAGGLAAGLAVGLFAGRVRKPGA